MKKGFTLMEMLAVVLVLAVVVSMAVPVFRSVRYEVKNSQAKAAAKKLAEAMRSYYQSSRGGVFEPMEDGFSPTRDKVLHTACGENSPAATGIPNKNAGDRYELSIEDAFACGYLSAKDFLGLPYKFRVCDVTDGAFCNQNAYVVVIGDGPGAGDKYNDPSKYYFYVDKYMQIREVETSSEGAE